MCIVLTRDGGRREKEKKKKKKKGKDMGSWWTGKKGKEEKMKKGI